MRFHSLLGLCFLASASLVAADSLPADNYLWGDDRMGKLVRRATKKSSSTTTSVKASSTTTKSSTTSLKSSSTTTQSTTTSVTTTQTTSSSSTVASSSTSSLVADAACTNGPLTRSCWGGGYSVATDFDQKHPTTGHTVTYNLEITNTTCNVDGNGNQQCLLINNQYPGPVITANWGDTVVVNVKNSMQDNGTSIHWHGIRQLNSCGSDGVNGITECPLAPGQSKAYTFLATQFGTSWYHSHYSSQYGSGVVGTIVINGPATSNYDVDLGTFPITDWYYPGAETVNDETLTNLQNGGGPPAADNIIINGTGKSASGAGSYAQVTVQPGKKHRLRLINTSVDNFFKVKLDNHAFTVMTADFIPVKPIPGQDWVMLAIGQRYDVVFTANQTSGSYFFRAEVVGDCFSANNGHGRALFTYAGTTPSAPADSNEAAPGGCTELVTVPYWKQAVDSSTFTSQVQTLNTGVGPGVSGNGQSLILWSLDTTSMVIKWDKPTLEYVANGSTDYPASYDMIEIPNEGTWTYWIVQIPAQQPPPPHPIHLHGHDFFVLGSGTGTFDVVSSTASLNFANPPRRDTAVLPGGGGGAWLALAFMANNPGAWLMHCHIAWHISEGLGVQFLEAKNSIVMPDQTQFNAQCASWKKFAATMLYPQIDSGL